VFSRTSPCRLSGVERAIASVTVDRF
jgi:hypothetical protein